MKLQYLFPAALIALEVGAAGVYFCQGNWRLGVYWVCAAICGAMITW